MDGLAPCCHEEADTRIFVHARNATEEGSKVLMIKANDTDVLVIAISVLSALSAAAMGGLWTGIASGMWVSRPGLGLETDQDHFFEFLVLVLVSTLLVLVLVLVLVLASMVLVSVLVSACLVLVLVSVSEGGLEQDLRLCATATLLVSKVETSK